MNKGFTLIELLGVLILLAIISLITVPAVLGVISDSKNSAIERSLDNYIVAVKAALSNYNTNNNLKNAECSIQNDGNLNCNGVILEISVKNMKPTSGTVVIRNYDVKDYYSVTIDNKTFNSMIFNGTKVAATQSDTHKGIIYLDPTDLSNACTAAMAAANLNNEDVPTPTGVTSGCMKFYIFDDIGDNYKMILDHNTSGNVSFNYTYREGQDNQEYDLGYITPSVTLVSNTNNVSNSVVLFNSGTNEVAMPASYEDYLAITSHIVHSSVDSAFDRLPVDTYGWVGNPRLITIDEIAHIVGVDTALGFDSTKEFTTLYALEEGETINAATQISWFWLDGTGTTYEEWQNWDDGLSDYESIANALNKSKYFWLYDYTDGCEESGCNIADYNSYPRGTKDSSSTTTIDGYWTSSTISSPMVGASDYAWCVDYSGSINAMSSGYSWSYGVRPVIELPKSVIDKK